MKDFKGTPGPWTVTPTISNNSYYAFFIHETTTDIQNEADLKLIAASKDMAEALQEVLACLWDAPEREHERKIIKAALLKALD